MADLDTQQATSAEWAELRAAAELVQAVEAVEAKSVKEALNLGRGYDVLIIDGRPHANSESIEAAERSNLAIIPTSNSFDDLKPSVNLAHALVDARIPLARIAFALSQVSTEAEAKNAREWLETTDYATLPSHLLYRPSWRRCGEEGTALTETRFQSVNDSARPLFDHITQQINN
ncbi:chromosome partitioning protein [Aliiruegeria haliotis]|uniref:Chromosome partitioning protein n=1 Tax=Aliiruegeria haliotis TaxID=1280846 RepID=A0A2T0RPQ3_9RHOB|nr:hypothetical protein [Aliiruegeria haliotis]PRY23169.1 chromosome partitioning protein [Aliiruegeria haliotis]